MNHKVDYDKFFAKAYNYIKTIRNPKAIDVYAIDTEVKEQCLFDYGENNLEKYSSIILAAKDLSQRVLIEIIYSLFETYNVQIKKIGNIDKSLLCIIDVANNCLLMFKDVEESKFFKLIDVEPPEIQIVLNKYKLSCCKYVYLMKDNAHLQLAGYVGKVEEYKIYALKWLFETYFDLTEYSSLLDSLSRYESAVETYIGYSVIKTLNPYTLISFRNITEKTLIQYKYETIMDKVIINNKNYKYRLYNKDYEKIHEQFLNKKYYCLMLGNHDYSESIITAEWLYMSLKKAKAIDLTVIGMCYFKAVEQFLYEIICLDDSGNRTIKSKRSKDKIPLNRNNIENDLIDFSIGSMSIYFKDNPDLIRNDLDKWGRNYVIESIFHFADLRNGYLHKNNIKEWSKIEEIRNTTLSLFFLIIGSNKLNNKDLHQLGIPSREVIDEHNKLFEYINFHCGEPFFLKKNNYEVIYIACPDSNSELIDGIYIKHSGAYFKELGEGSKKYRIDSQNIPDVVFLGKLNIKLSDKEEIKIVPEKLKKVFENGKFLIKSIVDEYNDEKF